MRAAWAPVVSRVRSTGYWGAAGQEHLLDGQALGSEGLSTMRA